MPNIKRTCLTLVTVLLAPMAAHALPLTIGDSFTVQNFNDGVPGVTSPGTVAAGVDAPLGGYRLFVNEGAEGLDWYVESAFEFCGWNCRGEDVVFVVSGLDFGGSFDIVNFFSDFATGTFAVLSDSSFSFSWTNDGDGTATSAQQRFIGGTFATTTSVPVPVPEPGTLALLGLSLAGIGMIRRSQKLSR